jgi:N-acylneuraminate cytidylyltransferase
MSRIAIVTARGGSKGIPRKNMRLVGGESLVARSVNSAKASKLFDIVVVSTDDDEIAAEAERWGGFVIRRPEALAGDGAKSIDAIVHALDDLKISDGLCCLLQPTSPLRTGEDIVAAHNYLISNDFDSVVSVCECEHHPYKALIFEGGKYSPVLGKSDFELPRQQLKKAYRINGAVYFNKVDTILRGRTFFGGRVGFFSMPSNRSIDIDSEIDIAIAEVILKGMKG